MSTETAKAIEEEYLAYCEDKSRDLTRMYELLYDHIYAYLSFLFQDKQYVEKGVLEELTQETLLAIAKKALDAFEKKDAMFATYCVDIAKKIAFSYMRKNVKKINVPFDKVENRTEEDEGITYYDITAVSSKEIYRNPEVVLLHLERQLEQIIQLRQYLQILMNQKKKPYMIVACCFSMILFHKYHPDTKELSSSSWAYEELGSVTVRDGADRYYQEINEWFPNYKLSWGAAFWDGLRKKKGKDYIGDIIFNKHFNVKNFENWTSRIRAGIRKELFEQAALVLE